MKLIDLMKERTALHNRIGLSGYYGKPAEYMISSPKNEKEKEAKARFTDLMREYNSINDKINKALVSTTITAGEYGNMTLSTAASYIGGWNSGIMYEDDGNIKQYINPVDLANRVVRSHLGSCICDDDDMVENGCTPVFTNPNALCNDLSRRENKYNSEMRNTLLIEFVKAVSDLEV